MLIQPFVNYNLRHGWYLTSSSIITANWKVNSNERWTVPVGGGVGRIVHFGKQPVNIYAQVLVRELKTEIPAKSSEPGQHDAVWPDGGTSTGGESMEYL